MTDAFMENYLNRNIYKVSNPPGGSSSINLSWNHPNQYKHENIPNHKLSRNQPLQPQNSNNLYHNKSIIQNHNHYYSNLNNNSMIYGDRQKSISYEQPYQNQNQYPLHNNRSFVSNIGNHSFRDNASFTQETNTQKLQKSPQITQNHNQTNTISESMDRNSYEHPISGKNFSTPFSYSKKGYVQYMSPNFIEPRNQMPSHDSSIHNWENSSKLLEEELKYYQEKNKLLKEKVYGGYTKDQALRKYSADFRDFSSRINMSNQPEQLQLAIRSRQKNMLYDNHEVRSNQQPYNNVLLDNLNSLLNGNGSMLMENQSTVKTSVKVHGPPGGYSSIKLG